MNICEPILERNHFNKAIVTLFLLKKCYFNTPESIMRKSNINVASSLNVLPSKLMINHKRMHTREKQYQCCHCGKWFAHRFILAAHQIIPIGEKPYQCNNCVIYFDQNVSMLLPYLMHTRKKPYQCSYCEKDFSVLIHQRMHTREKPY